MHRFSSGAVAAQKTQERHLLADLDDLLTENSDLLESPLKPPPQKQAEDSYDLDSSDDLNKIISKFELSLEASSGKKPPAKPPLQTLKQQQQLTKLQPRAPKLSESLDEIGAIERELDDDNYSFGSSDEAEEEILEEP